MALAKETRYDRNLAVGQLTQAIAAAEMGSDEAAEQLISASEAALLPLGAKPLLGVVAMARGRQALAYLHWTSRLYESVAAGSLPAPQLGITSRTPLRDALEPPAR